MANVCLETNSMFKSVNSSPNWQFQNYTSKFEILKTAMEWPYIKKSYFYIVCEILFRFKIEDQRIVRLLPGFHLEINDQQEWGQM